MQGVISITGWVDDYTTPLSFAAGTLREISSLGPPLDFDLYSEND